MSIGLHVFIVISVDVFCRQNCSASVYLLQVQLCNAIDSLLPQLVLTSDYFCTTLYVLLMVMLVALNMFYFTFLLVV